MPTNAAESTRPHPVRSAASSTLRLATRLAVAFVAVSTVGLAGTYLATLVPIWPFSLFEHFAVQLVVGGIVVVAAAAALRMRGYFDIALVATLLHLQPVARDLCTEPRPVLDGGAVVRVLVLNVHTSGSSFDEVRRLIDDVQPDILGLVEVDDRWLAALAPAVARFQGRIDEPRDDNFGVALFARAGLSGKVEELGSSLPSIVADVPVVGRNLGVILTHPIPPVSADALRSQEAQLDAVANRVRTLGSPAIVMGDLNATPWSRPFRRLVARSGLCDSRAGFGIQATFPAATGMLRIPLDHLLASCGIGISNRRVERDVGSDHLPVVIEIVVPQ